MVTPCSNRCLIAVTSVAVLRSARFRVDDSLSPEHRTYSSCDYGTLVFVSEKMDSTSLRLFHGSRTRE